MLRHGFFFLNKVHKKVSYGRVSIRWNRFYKKIKKIFPIWKIIKNHKWYTIQKRWWETFSDSNRQWEKVILKTHHRITICCDIIIYRILDLISDDRVERPSYLDEIDGNFWIINFIVKQEPTIFLGRTNTWNSLVIRLLHSGKKQPKKK